MGVGTFQLSKHSFSCHIDNILLFCLPMVVLAELICQFVCSCGVRVQHICLYLLLLRLDYSIVVAQLQRNVIPHRRSPDRPVPYTLADFQFPTRFFLLALQRLCKNGRENSFWWKMEMGNGHNRSTANTHLKSCVSFFCI